MTTVSVSPLPHLLPDEPQHLLMTWAQVVTTDDVRDGFRAIMAALNASQQPLFVVVDIRSNPRFPVTITIAEAIDPYRHEHLEAWLIVGQNFLAQSIERVLATMAKRKNVYWFDTLEDAVQYIKLHQPNE